MTGERRRWSAEDDARLLEMCAGQESYDNIAAALSRSIGAVVDRYWLVRRRSGAAATPRPKPLVAKKPCSSCKQMFTPLWKTNYRCPDCKKKYKNASPFEPGGGDTGRRVKRA